MSQVKWERPAKNALARYGKDDPAGVDQVLDSVNLLPRDPRPSGALDCGGGRYRLYAGRYRVCIRSGRTSPW
ncbi:hypothetical protein [Streptomyces sp. NPDC005438]|uniref:hypothetical protein n=1 Tax=Streptomyces sp. NPDC005438 TaxID=3156880 RepID=UPI0033A44BD5